MKVVATIQSTLPGEHEPVDVTWYNGDNAVSALVSIGQIIQAPETTFTRTLSIRIDL